MAPDTASVFTTALSLAPEQRALLAEKLLDSLVISGGDEIESAWIEEAGRRLAAFERGEIKAISEEEVFRSLPGFQKP